MALNNYLKQVQGLIRDRSQVYLNPSDLISYVNQGRREVALRTRCVRRLTPISGQVVTATITNGGTGYVNPVATISAPDFPSGYNPSPNGAQATAVAQQIGGVVTQIDITFGGYGYFSPVITITDANGGPGTGATATLTTTPTNTTQNGQEVYRFADLNMSSFPGVGPVFFVNSISILYASFRFSCLIYSFSEYQALVRNWVQGYRYVPSISTQFGRGTDGSMYLYPIASAPYQMEFDCACLPADLETDQDYDTIPQPWSDCVQYFAAHLAFLELQNLNAAQWYLNRFDSITNDHSAWAVPRRVSNRYGRR